MIATHPTPVISFLADCSGLHDLSDVTSSTIELINNIPESPATLVDVEGRASGSNMDPGLDDGDRLDGRIRSLMRLKREGFVLPVRFLFFDILWL